MFDRLPTPFGLVRAGVAPDHPKIKSVIRVYEKTAAREGFQLLRQRRDRRRRDGRRARRALPRVVSAYGHRDRSPARDPGRGPARLARGDRVRRLVQRPPRLRRRTSSTCRAKRVVVIGNGNVAADVARMLALPRDELRGDRHRRPRDRGAGRRRGSRRSSCSDAAVPPRPRSPTPRSASSASSPTPTSSSTPPRSTSTRRSREYLESDELRAHPPPQRRDLHRVLTAPRARGQAEAGRDAVLLLADRDQGRRQGRGDRRRSQRALPRRRPARSAPATPASARRSSAAWCCARSATRASGLEGFPFDADRGLIPNDAGRVIDPRRAARRSPATTRSAGSSAGRRG